MYRYSERISWPRTAVVTALLARPRSSHPRSAGRPSPRERSGTYTPVERSPFGNRTCTAGSRSTIERIALYEVTGGFERPKIGRIYRILAVRVISSINSKPSSNRARSSKPFRSSAETTTSPASRTTHTSLRWQRFSTTRFLPPASKTSKRWTCRPRPTETPVYIRACHTNSERELLFERRVVCPDSSDSTEPVGRWWPSACQGAVPAERRRLHTRK